MEQIILGLLRRSELIHAHVNKSASTLPQAFQKNCG